MAWATFLLCAVPSLALAMGSKENCVDLGVLVNAQTMESTRSFTRNTDNSTGGYGLLRLWVQLTDANTSITRFDIACTVSDDSNVTDYIPQVCDSTLDGVCTLTDSGTWQKASPGTKNFPIGLDIEGFPDFACAFSVGAGTGAAADVLTVRGRICTK